MLFWKNYVKLYNEAQNKPLGRVATEAAKLLRGKHKPTYTPHVNCGDAVIIINAGKVNLTGDKLDKKIYYNHSGFPGGLREIFSFSSLIYMPSHSNNTKNTKMYLNQINFFNNRVISIG